MAPIPCLEVVRCEADVHSVMFSVVTVAWYTTSSTIHSPFSGKSSFFLQLHFLPSSRCSVVVSAFFRMVLLWPSMICLTLGMQLYLSFRVFLLKNFLSLWPDGKDRSIRVMNSRPMLFLMFLLNGGLNHTTFSQRLRFCDGVS